MAKSVSVLQRQKYTQKSFSYPWNPSIINTAAVSNQVTRKSLRPEATVAYLAEDKKSKAEEVTIERLKTKLSTSILTPMSQCPCTLHCIGKKISHDLSQRLMPSSWIQRLVLPQPPEHGDDRDVPHTPGMVRGLLKGRGHRRIEQHCPHPLRHQQLCPLLQ